MKGIKGGALTLFAPQSREVGGAIENRPSIRFGGLQGLNGGWRQLFCGLVGLFDMRLLVFFMR